MYIYCFVNQPPGSETGPLGSCWFVTKLYGHEIIYTACWRFNKPATSGYITKSLDLSTFYIVLAPPAELLYSEQPVTCTTCWAIVIWTTCHLHPLLSYCNLNNLSLASPEYNSSPGYDVRSFHPPFSHSPQSFLVTKLQEIGYIYKFKSGVRLWWLTGAPARIDLFTNNTAITDEPVPGAILPVIGISIQLPATATRVIPCRLRLKVTRYVIWNTIKQTVITKIAWIEVMLGNQGVWSSWIYHWSNI